MENEILSNIAKYYFTLQTYTMSFKIPTRGQRDSRVGRVIEVYMVDPGCIPRRLYLQIPSMS